MSLTSQLESLLFVATRPLSLKKIAGILSSTEDDVTSSIEELSGLYNAERGMRIVVNDGQVQMTTSSENAALVSEFLKEELSGELKGAALETLSVIVYRAPISKAEIEHIRGVNCTQSLRNLSLRGLIEERKGEHTGERAYVPTIQFLNHLGIQNTKDLPNYEKLHSVDISGSLDSMVVSQ